MSITRPATGYVCIKGRDDLDPTAERIEIDGKSEPLIVNPDIAKVVTSLADNVGVCEVVAVGDMVDTVKVGDITFIDYFDVNQGYIVAGTEHYICPAHALKVYLDSDGKPHPLPGYVLTKHSPERMTVAVQGSDRVIMPREITSRGIVSRRDSDGEPDAWTVYEEVVEVAKGDMQVAPEKVRDEYHEKRLLRLRIDQLENALHQETTAASGPFDGCSVHPALKRPHPTGYEPGDLAVFCTHFGVRFRANWEWHRVTPKRNVLAIIDDRAILAAYNKTNPPKPLVKLMGAGGSLYGV